MSFKVMPGVRVGVSSRGIRAGVGPRVARVHVGAGRTGISSGIGPVGLYSSLGGRRRSSAWGAASAYGSSGGSPTPLQQAKAEQAAALAASFTNILDLHREAFDSACAPVANAPEPVDSAAVLRNHKQEQLRGIGILRFGERKTAKQRATASAEAEVVELNAHRAAQTAEAQRELDQAWQRLNANDPEVVLATLNEAFVDNAAPAAAVAVADGVAFLVVHVPGAGAVPERLPQTTAAGNLSLKRLSKTETNDFHMLMVCGYVVATIKETFGVAPRLEAAHVAAIRSSGSMLGGRRGFECVMTTRVARSALSQFDDWENSSSASVLAVISSTIAFDRKGRAKDLQALDLDGEPELRALLDHIQLGVA